MNIGKIEKPPTSTALHQTIWLVIPIATGSTPGLPVPSPLPLRCQSETYSVCI